jgi:hypothetical protein
MNLFNWLAGLQYRDKLTHFEMGKGSVEATLFFYWEMKFG